MVYKVFERVFSQSRGIRICFPISDISGERLWVELKRIAEGRNAGPILKKMFEQNIGQYLGRISLLPRRFFELQV